MKRKKKVITNARMKVIHQKLGIEDAVQVYNFFGTIIGLLVFFCQLFFKFVISMSIIVTLVGFIIIFKFNKSVEFINFSRPYVGITIFLNSVAIGVISSVSSNSVYSTLFWIYFIMCCVILSILMFILKKNAFKTVISLIFLLVSISAYSMGIITCVNYLYDNSKPSEYYTSIIRKVEIQGGVKYGFKSYDVWVSPCGPINKNIDVAVSKDFYDAVHYNQWVKLSLKSGLLGIKWYYLN